MQEEFPTNFLSMIQDNVPIMCTSSLFGFNTKSKSCLAPCHIMEKAHWNTQCIVNGICEIEIDVKELGHYHTTPPPDLVVGFGYPEGMFADHFGRLVGWTKTGNTLEEEWI